MTMTECNREPEILEALVTEQWPEELRRHASGCPVCGDLALVAALFRDDRDDAWSHARLPTSGQIWWRATLRRRAEAGAAAARPITLLQGVAGACAAGACAAVITRAWSSIEQPLRWLSVRGGSGMEAAALSESARLTALWPIAVALGASLILAPLVVYFVLSDD